MAVTRRESLQTLLLAGATAAGWKPGSAAEKSETHVPIRAITKGPKHHWFGYYDKLEFDATNRYVLSNQVDFEHRSPRADDVIQVGMVDTQDSDRWIELGQSKAWGWQQGCMLQWRPGAADEVLWNDRVDDHFACHVLNVKTKKRRTLPMPVYTVSSDGQQPVTAAFARITTLGEMAKLPYRGKTLEDKWNYFNHLLVSPDGRRFIFLHRWRQDGAGSPTGGFTTRMFTANMDGSGLFELDPSGNTSHFIWRDPQHICAWTRPAGKKAAFYLFQDKTRKVDIVGEGVMTHNGHNTYLPVGENQWILNDTYPDGRRRQTPYLFNVATGKRFDLGHFYSPPEYKGEWRCDTHPRSSRDGLTVAIDSPHGGDGRQVWLLDVREIVG